MGDEKEDILAFYRHHLELELPEPLPHEEDGRWPRRVTASLPDDILAIAARLCELRKKIDDPDPLPNNAEFAKAQERAIARWGAVIRSEHFRAVQREGSEGRQWYDAIRSAEQDDEQPLVSLLAEKVPMGELARTQLSYSLRRRRVPRIAMAERDALVKDLAEGAEQQIYPALASLFALRQLPKGKGRPPKRKYHISDEVLRRIVAKVERAALSPPGTALSKKQAEELDKQVADMVGLSEEDVAGLRHYNEMKPPSSYRAAIKRLSDPKDL